MNCSKSIYTHNAKRVQHSIIQYKCLHCFENFSDEQRKAKKNKFFQVHIQINFLSLIQTKEMNDKVEV